VRLLHIVIVIGTTDMDDINVLS